MFFLLVFIASLGLLNSLHLYLQYKRFELYNKKMICLAGENCEEVLNSKYGRTLGVKNEVLGMAYYSLLITSLLAARISTFWPEAVKINVYFITSFAAAFSLYLLFIQLFVLKKACSWCLGTIAINLILLSVLILGKNPFA